MDEMQAPNPEHDKDEPIEALPADAVVYSREDELIHVERKSSGSLAATALVGVAGAVAIGAGFVYEKWSTARFLHLPDALPAPRHSFLSEQAGQIAYYAEATDSGRPLVLVHSVNAAAGAHEMQPLFENYLGHRPLYALDLPGYGFSDRSNRNYSPDLYAGVLADFLRKVVRAPADVVALSLGSEFAARAAQIEPSLVASLAFISPSGFSRKSGIVQGVAGSRSVGGVTHATLALPFLSQALFDSLTMRKSIQFYLRKSFVGQVPEWLIDYAYATAHQAGAKNAPLYFVSGLLFTPQAHATLYPGVTQPVLVIYDDDPYVNFEMLPDFEAAHSNWQSQRIAPTLGLPHWEKPEETFATLDLFWQGVPG